MRTSGARGVVVLLAVAALAGCSNPMRDDANDPDAPDESNEGGSCESRFGGTLAPIVSLVPTLQDDADVAMMRLAEVVNDSPRDAPVAEGSALAWAAERGTFYWMRDGNASARVAYDGPLPGAPAETIQAALATFSSPLELVSTEDGTQTLQTIGPYSIEGTGASYLNGTLTVGPLVQLDPNVEVADEATLLARAREVAACVDPDALADGGGLLSYRLRDEVLVQRVEVPTGPEGCAAEVHVDLHAVDGTLAPPILCLADMRSA